MSRTAVKKSTLDAISIDFLLCRALRHAWRDVDMLYVMWGSSQLEQWNLECDRCLSKASEYRDPVTSERVGQRQYTHISGYALDYRYSQADYFAELRRRRSAEPRVSAGKTVKSRSSW